MRRGHARHRARRRARRAGPVRRAARLAGRDRRWRARGRAQRHPPSRLRAGARHAAASALRLGGRPLGEGGRPDGEERERLRPVPPARRLARHGRVHRRRDPAHPPRPAASRWFRCDTADPVRLLAAVHRPASVLWDGTTTWVLLEGHPADIDAQAVAPGLAETDGPPALPPHRWSIEPHDVVGLTGTFVAEVGVGVVHHARPAASARGRPGRRTPDGAHP